MVFYALFIVTSAERNSRVFTYGKSVIAHIDVSLSARTAYYDFFLFISADRGEIRNRYHVRSIDIRGKIHVRVFSAVGINAPFIFAASHVNAFAFFEFVFYVNRYTVNLPLPFDSVPVFFKNAFADVHLLVPRLPYDCSRMFVAQNFSVFRGVNHFLNVVSAYALAHFKHEHDLPVYPTRVLYVKINIVFFGNIFGRMNISRQRVNRVENVYSYFIVRGFGIRAPLARGVLCVNGKSTVRARNEVELVPPTDFALLLFVELDRSAPRSALAADGVRRLIIKIVNHGRFGIRSVRSALAVGRHAYPDDRFVGYPTESIYFRADFSEFDEIRALNQRKRRFRLVARQPRVAHYAEFERARYAYKVLRRSGKNVSRLSRRRTNLSSHILPGPGINPVHFFLILKYRAARVVYRRARRVPVVNVYFDISVSITERNRTRSVFRRGQLLFLGVVVRIGRRRAQVYVWRRRVDVDVEHRSVFVNRSRLIRRAELDRTDGRGKRGAAHRVGVISAAYGNRIRNRAATAAYVLQRERHLSARPGIIDVFNPVSGKIGRLRRNGKFGFVRVHFNGILPFVFPVSPRRLFRSRNVGYSENNNLAFKRSVFDFHRIRVCDGNVVLPVVYGIRKQFFARIERLSAAFFHKTRGNFESKSRRNPSAVVRSSPSHTGGNPRYGRGVIGRTHRITEFAGGGVIFDFIGNDSPFARSARIFSAEIHVSVETDVCLGIRPIIYDGPSVFGYLGAITLGYRHPRRRRFLRVGIQSGGGFTVFESAARCDLARNAYKKIYFSIGEHVNRLIIGDNNEVGVRVAAFALSHPYGRGPLVILRRFRAHACVRTRVRKKRQRRKHGKSRRKKCFEQIFFRSRNHISTFHL